MKKLTTIIAVLGAYICINGCSKPDEVVPENKGFIRDYVLPSASFLTPAERAEVEAIKEEYRKIL